MSRYLILLFALFLAGCYSDQKQQVAACELQANQHARTTDDMEIRARESSEETELCMRAHGYELVEDNCPVNLRTGCRPECGWNSVWRDLR